HVPADDTTTVVHGDFRLGNMVVDSAEPRVLAVLDWELSTLGHPLGDLAYACVPYRLPPELDGVRGLDLAALGIPDEAASVSAHRAAGHSSLGLLRGLLALPPGRHLPGDHGPGAGRDGQRSAGSRAWRAGATAGGGRLGGGHRRSLSRATSVNSDAELGPLPG